MNPAAHMSFRLVLSCIAFIIGEPCHGYAQELAPPGLIGSAGKGENTIMAIVSPEGLTEPSSDDRSAIVTSSDSAHPHVFMVVGTGEQGFKGDGDLATRAHLWFAASVAVDQEGNVFVADSFNNRIRRVDALTGTIHTVAGNGTQGYSGDGDLATSAKLNSPGGVAIDRQGNVLIADTFNHRIRVVDTRTGIISTLAGTGEPWFSGDGGLAIAAKLSGPTALVVDADDRILIADSGNHRIRRLDRHDGAITTVAGMGAAGMSGDSGSAVQAQLNGPAGVAIDRKGNILIADTFNHRIRHVDATSGIITTIAGSGEEGFGGDGGPAATARLMQPSGVTVDAEGVMYIADTFNSRIRRVDSQTNIITTLAGTEEPGHAGNGTPAHLASLSYPMAVTTDPLGNLVVADSENHCVLRIIR